MVETFKYIAIIPARKGSKRVPNKNMRIINGAPLIYWTIKKAKESTLIDKVIVSTDSEEIKKYCENQSVEVVDRPESLSGDNIGLVPVMKHVITLYPSDNIILLRPTSPIRENHIIDVSINKFESLHGNSLCTGFFNKEVPAFTQPDGPSQSRKGWFQNDGCIEIHKSDIILEGKSYGNRTLKLEVDETHNYEIDTELDLYIVECIMKKLGMKL